MFRLSAICAITVVSTLAIFGVVFLLVIANPPRPQQPSPNSQWLKKIDCVSRKIQSNPDQAELYLQRAKAILSRMHEVIDNNSFSTKYTHCDVLADLETAIQHDSTMGEAHFEKGCVLLSSLWIGKEQAGGFQGRRSDAVKAFSRAIKLLDEPAWAYAGRAQALKGLRRRAEALRDLETATDLSPLDSELYRTKECLALELRDYRMAIEARAKAAFLEDCKSEVTVRDLAGLELDDSAFEPISIEQDTTEVREAKLELTGIWQGEMYVRRFGTSDLVHCQLTFDGQQGSLEVDSPLGLGKASFSIRVDPLETPWQIDVLVSSGDHDVLGRTTGTALGICELSDNQLRLCFAFDSAPRPTVFTHVAPHPYQRFFVLQREATRDVQ